MGVLRRGIGTGLVASVGVGVLFTTSTSFEDGDGLADRRPPEEFTERPSSFDVAGIAVSATTSVGSGFGLSGSNVGAVLNERKKKTQNELIL